MKVPIHVKQAFDYVCAYMKLTPAEVQECRQEFIANPEWGIEFYPAAERVIRASQGEPIGNKEREQ